MRILAVGVELARSLLGDQGPRSPPCLEQPGRSPDLRESGHPYKTGRGVPAEPCCSPIPLGHDEIPHHPTAHSSRGLRPRRGKIQIIHMYICLYVRHLAGREHRGGISAIGCILARMQLASHSSEAEMFRLRRGAPPLNMTSAGTIAQMCRSMGILSVVCQVVRSEWYVICPVTVNL